MNNKIKKTGFITVGDFLNNNKVINITKKGSALGGSVSLMSSLFYTPELTPESWLLPKSRVEVLKWARIFYNLEPYIQSIINLHAQYPFSKFRLISESSEISNFFEQAIDNENWSLLDFILRMSLSYWIYGEGIAFGNWDEKNRIWKNFSLLEPEVVEIKQGFYDPEPTFELIPTEELKKLILETKAKEELAKIPEIVKQSVMSQKNIPLDPKCVSVIARLTSPSAIRGTPIIQCLAGDTKIPLLDGTTKTIKELYDEKAKNFWVYSIDHNGKIVPGKANKVIYTKTEETLKITLDNGEYFKCSKEHPILLRNGEWKRADELTIGTSLMPLYRKIDKKVSKSLSMYFALKHTNAPINHTIVAIEHCKAEELYDIQSVDTYHNFAISFNDGSGIFVHNCLFKVLIYQDYIRLAQMRIAERHQMPFELWSVGNIEHKILPTEEDLQRVKNMIEQAIQNPPFTMVFPPILNYQALGVKDRLLAIYDDIAYIQDMIMVGLGVNKNLILGEGPSFSNVKTMALHRLIMEYQTIRDKFERWIYNKVFRRISEENKFFKFKGKIKHLIIPRIQWDKSLNIENEDIEKKYYLELHKAGYVSTKTLFTKFTNLDFDTEKKNLEEEINTIFDKKKGARLPEGISKSVKEEPVIEPTMEPTIESPGLIEEAISPSSEFPKVEAPEMPIE